MPKARVKLGAAAPQASKEHEGGGCTDLPKARVKLRAAAPQTSKEHGGGGGLQDKGEREGTEDGPVDVQMKLGISFLAAGPPHSLVRAEFEKTLLLDLSSASGLAPEGFCVQKMAPGSVIVDMQIRYNPKGAGPKPPDVARDLQRQVSDSNSPLRQGKITRYVESITNPSKERSTDAGSSGAGIAVSPQPPQPVRAVTATREVAEVELRLSLNRANWSVRLEDPSERQELEYNLACDVANASGIKISRVVVLNLSCEEHRCWSRISEDITNIHADTRIHISCTHTHIARTHTLRAHTHTFRAHTHARMHAYKYICAHSCVRAHMCSYVRRCIHARTHIHSYTFIHTLTASS